MCYMFVFIYSSIFGSFLHVCAQNSPQKKPFLFRHSHCDYCKQEISFKHMIPIVSYIVQKGKTICCQKALHKMYFWQEITFPILMLVLYQFYLMHHIGMVHFIVFLFLYYFLLTDIYFLHVPNLALGFFLTIILIFQFLNQAVLFATIQLIISFIAYSACYYFVKKGFGLGDIKILIILGTAVGFATSYKIFIYALTIAAISLGVACLTHKISRKKMIPFVPFIFLGYLSYLCLKVGGFE